MSAELNTKILDKIDDMDISRNKKKFLKEALKLEYENRDNVDHLKKKYIPLINKYYAGDSNDY